MRRFVSTIFLTVILISSGVQADEIIENSDDKIHPIVQFAVFEGIITGLSWLGTTNYAGIFVITHPFALAEALNESNDTLFYTGVVSAEALAIYSISLDEDEYSRGERFRKNMIAWHVFFGVVGVTAWLTGDDGFFDGFVHNQDESVAFSFTPLINGGKLHASFRY